MKTILLAALAVALASPVLAEDAPKPEPKTLTVAECLTMLSGLRALSGKHDVVVKEDGKDKVAQIPWRFDGPTLLTIGLDIGALQQVEAAVARTRQELLVQNADKDGKDPTSGTALYNAFISKLQAALDAPCPVHPGRLKVSELRLGGEPGQNAIPGDVIGAISALLDRE